MSLAFSLATLLAAHSADTVRTFHNDLPSHSVYTVTHAQGDVQVFPTAAGDAARAELEVRCTGGAGEEERKFVAGFRIDVVAPLREAPCRIATHIPDSLTKPPALSYQAELRLWLPREAVLEIDSRYGAVRVSDRKAALRIENHLGPIEVRSITGDVHIENHYDRVSIDTVQGSVYAATNSETLEIRRVDGSITAINRFGAVRIDDARGRVSVENRMAAVVLTNLGADCEVRAPHCDVTLSDVAGSGTLLGNNGAIECTRIAGALKVEHRHSSLVARQVGGALTVLGDFLPTLGEDLDGEVKVQTTSSSVTLTRVRGAVDVETTSGAVILTDLRGALRGQGEGGLWQLIYTTWSPEHPAQPRSVENRLGPLEVWLPDSFDATLTALSSIGTIECEFPGMVCESLGRALRGVLRGGTGTTPLDLTCLGNAIRVRRLVPER